MADSAWLGSIDQNRVITRYRVNGGEWQDVGARDATTGAAVIFADPTDRVEFEYSDDPPNWPAHTNQRRDG
jgi:hypothetical protein